jgi:hypothetical protein
MEYNPRSFNSLNTILSASERSAKKRQTTVYNDVVKNIAQTQSANPVKKDGYTYNKNTGLQPICDLSAGHVNFARNYEILADMKQGSQLVYPQPVATPTYEILSDNLEYNNRSFNSFNTILSAGERSAKKRQTTVYNDVVKNIAQTQSANPVKKNGYTYNKNTGLQPICDLSAGHVNFARNYEILADMKQGSQLVYPVPVSTPKYESWCGNLYAVNYQAHGVATVVDASGIIDPSYNLFYDACALNYGNINKPDPWLNVVDLSFQQTYFARTAAQKTQCSL